PELVVRRIGGEIGVIGEALCGPFAQACRKHGIACRRVTRQRNGLLKCQPWQRAGKFLLAEEIASGGACGHRRKGAPGKRTEAVLQRECARCSEYPPFEEIAAVDLPMRKGLHDLRTIVSRQLCFALTCG